MHKLRNELKRLLSIVLVAVLFLSFAPANAIATYLPEGNEHTQGAGEYDMEQNGEGGYPPEEEPGEEPDDDPNVQEGDNDSDDEQCESYEIDEEDLVAATSALLGGHTLDLSYPPTVSEADIWNVLGNQITYLGSGPLTITRSSDTRYSIIVRQATQVYIENNTAINGGLHLQSTENVTIYGQGSNINISNININAATGEAISAQGNLTMSGTIGSIMSMGNVSNGISAVGNITITGSVGNISTMGEQNNGISAGGNIIISGTVGSITSTGEWTPPVSRFGSSVASLGERVIGISANGSITISGTVGNIFSMGERSNGISASGNVAIYTEAEVGEITVRNIGNDEAGWGIGIHSRDGNVTIFEGGIVGTIISSHIGIGVSAEAGGININAPITVSGSSSAFNRQPIIGISNFEATWSNYMTGEPVADSDNVYGWLESHRWVQFIAVPMPPANFSVAAYDIFSITLEWDEINDTDLSLELQGGEIAYNVYRRNTADAANVLSERINEYPIPAADAQTRRFRDTTAVRGVNHTYFVRAVVTLDDEPQPFVSRPSSTASSAALRPITEAQLIPTATQPQGPFSAQVTWTGASRANEYVVYRRIVSPAGAANVWGPVASWSAAAPGGITAPAGINGQFRWTDNDVSPGHTYQYRIVARYIFGADDIPRPPGALPPDIMRTSMQRQLAAMPMAAPRIASTGVFGITLDWPEVVSGDAEITYNVFRRPATQAAFTDDRPINDAPIEFVPGPGVERPSFTDRTASPGGRYVYRIQVLVGGAAAGYSNHSIIATMPQAPNTPAQLAPTITQGATERFSATVRWTASGLGANGTDIVQRQIRGENGEWPGDVWETLGGNIVPSGTQRMLVDDGLLAGRTYRYRIVRTWTAGDAARTVESTMREITSRALAAPTAVETGMFHVELRWEQIPETGGGNVLQGFNVYRRLSTEASFPTDPINTGLITAAEPTFVDDRVLPGVTYVYAIRAVFNNGSEISSGMSLARQVTTLVPISVVNLAPTVTANGARGATVSWSAAGYMPTITSYEVWLSKRDHNGIWSAWEDIADITGLTVSNIPAANGNGRAIDVSGLEPSATYQFRVVGIWSTTHDRTVSVQSLARQFTAAALPGLVPAGVRATAPAPEQVTINWNAIPGVPATTGLVGYFVHFSGRDGPVFVPVTRVPSTSYPFTGLVPNTTYQAWVQGVWNIGGDQELCPNCPNCVPEWGDLCARYHAGPPSAVINAATTGPAPRSLAIARESGSLTPTSVTLSWLAPSAPGGLVGYRISRDGVPVAWVPAERLSWTDNGLTPGVPARYTVEALWYFDAAANEGRGGGSMPGTSSNVLTVNTPNPAPGGLARMPAGTPARTTHRVNLPGGTLPSGDRAWDEWESINTSPTPAGFTISFNAINGTNAERLVAYNVYIDGREPIRVPARYVPGQPDNVTFDIRHGGGNTLTRARSGAIRVRISNADFPELFARPGDPIAPNTAYSVRVQGEWLPVDGTPGEDERRGASGVPVSMLTTGAAPAGLNRDVTGATHTDLRWNRIPDALGYEITFSDGREPIRVPNPDPGVPNTRGVNDIIRFDEDASPQMRISGLQPNTAYFFTVRAYWVLDSWGEPILGSRSAAHNFRTTGPAPTQPTAAVRTGTNERPGAVIDQTESGYFVELRWSFAWPAANRGVVGFLIYKDGVPHVFEPLGAGSTPDDPRDTPTLGLTQIRDRNNNITRLDLVWNDTGAVPGMAATYMVQAVWTVPGGNPQANLDAAAVRDHGGGGTISAARSITPNPTGTFPAGLAAGTTATELAIRWNAIADITTGTGVNLIRHARVSHYIVEIGNEQEWDSRDAQPDEPTTSRRFRGLTPNTLYPIRVTVYWLVGEDTAPVRGRTTTFSIRTLNPVPPTPAISPRMNLTGTSVGLQWGTVAGGADGYFVYRDGERIDIVAGPTGTGAAAYTFTDHDLNPGINAIYTIRAFWCVDGCGPGTGHHLHNVGDPLPPCLRVSALSGTRAVAPPGAMLRSVSVPARIGTPPATNIIPREFTVTWLPPNPASMDSGATRIHSYRVELWHDGINITDYAQTETGTNIVPAYGAGAHSLRFIGLEPNTRYQIRVIPVWERTSDGRLREGRPSGLINAATTGPAPAGLRAVPGTLTNVGVELTWTPLAEELGALGYMVYRDLEPIMFITDATFRAAGNTWHDGTLSPGIAARYTVRAYWTAPQLLNTALEDGAPALDTRRNPIGGRPGNRSAVLTVTPPSAIPAGVAARPMTATSVSVAWNAMAAGADAPLHEFRVEILLGGRVVATETVAADAPRLAEFEGLMPNTAYQARVTPVWDAGLGTGSDLRPGRASALAAVRTAGLAPASLRIVPGSLTHTGVRLGWNPVADRGVVGYVIFKDGAEFGFVSREQFARDNNTWQDLTLRPGVLARYTARAVWCASPDCNITEHDIDSDCLRDADDRLLVGNTTAALNVTPLGAAPGNVRAAINSPTMLTVTWNAVPAAAGYIVSVRHPASINPEMSFERTVSASELRALQFPGLQPNVRYLVSVTGIWDAGRNPAKDISDSCMACAEHRNSGGTADYLYRHDLDCEDCTTCTACGWVRFRTGRSTELNAAATAGPAPARLRAVAGTLNSTSVQLTWEPVADVNVKGYLISKNGAAIDFVAREDFLASNGLWTYHGLNPGVLARFTVQACWGEALVQTAFDGSREWDGSGKPGIASNILPVTAPDGGRPAPAGVRAVVGGPTAITVTWDAVAGIHGYRVELLQGGRVAAYSGLIRNDEERTFTFGMGVVNPNTAYQVRVVGVWANLGARPAMPESRQWQWPPHRDGRASALIAARTTAPAVTGLRVALAADSLSRDSVRLAWNPPINADATGVQGYLVYLDNRPIEFVTADEFRAARNTWTATGLVSGARTAFSVQPMWDIPLLPETDSNGNWIHDPELIDARGNWIPNGKPGIRTANINVIPPAR